MFYHAFNGYMEHAFPKDELRPLSCEGEDTLGSYALTLVFLSISQFLLMTVHRSHFLICLICVIITTDQIDSLDTLALLGDREQFTTSVEWIGKNLQFNIVSHGFFFIYLFFYFDFFLFGYCFA